MNKLLLSLLIPFMGLPMVAQESTTTPNVSLDFTVNGITYTILDDVNKTCQTKAGYGVLDPTIPKLIYTYGNNNSGDVTIPAKVTYPEESGTEYTVVAIGNFSFDKAINVTIEPEGVTTINDYAFFGNKSLESITIPESVTSIGKSAFYDCEALAVITLPSNIQTIGDNAFGYTGLTSVALPENIVSVGSKAFSNCSSLKTVTIPGSVLQLGTSVFAECSGLSELTLGEGINLIPASAFSKCNNLTTLELPSSVTSIGAGAFNCSSLTSITSYAKAIPAISASSFNSENYNNATLYVYNTALTSYQSSSLWGAFSNIEPIQVDVAGISIMPSTLNINVGLTAQLSAILTPEDAIGTVEWEVSSSTPSGCISVDESGLVTAKQIGNGVITAKSGSFSAICNVIINANPDEYVVVNQPDGDIYVGNTVILTASVFPPSIIPSLTWNSSNTDVATIDEFTGELTAIAPGATVITAVNDGISGSLVVNVNPILPDGISLDITAVTLKVGENKTLKATVTPENATNPIITWESSDPTVAIVSEGIVTAVGVGEANIRAMAGDFTANCEVTVEPTLAENVALNIETSILKIGQSLQLIATVTPDNTTNKSIDWSSSNPEVVTVTTDGIVIALTQGSATITAQCGEVSATCEIAVEAIDSEELLMNYSSISLQIGSTQQLTATIYPENTTDQTITWESSNADIATVQNGLVTAISEGTATITAKNGSLSATCEVTVSPVFAEQVILDQTSVIVNVNEYVIISASVLPENVTDNTIVWTSLNPEVATVTNGMITGIAPGSTVITAVCGSANSSCTVTVLQPATSISLNESELVLYVGDIVDLIETVNPENTTDVVVWASANTDVAIVDNNGIVTAVKAGRATITATCGSVSATCEVTVYTGGSDSIEGINPEALEGVYNVFNLQGIKVLNTKQKADLSNLTPGVYIINGQKAVIK